MGITFESGKFKQPEAVLDDGQHLSDLVDAQNAARRDAPTAHPELERLIRTIWRLRQADGCPWDREQTHASIQKNMIEEAYEAVDCIVEDDVAHLCEELGDVLEQVLLHSQIAADAGEFTIDDVAHGLNEKLVRRHPHVFGNLAEGEGVLDGEAAADGEAALDRWDEVKRLEREARGELADGNDPGLLDSVPTSLPALMQAQKISKRAVKVGFEWESTADVWAKVAEERAEFEAEAPGSEAAALEFGDLLFALVNVARREGIDAEEALAASNAKFRERWTAMETAAASQGKTLEDFDTAQLNDLWNQVKENN